MPENVVRTYFKEQRTGPLFSRGTARGGDVTRDIMRATAEDIPFTFVKEASPAGEEGTAIGGGCDPFEDVLAMPDVGPVPLQRKRLSRARRRSVYASTGQMSSAVRVAETLDLGMFLLPRYRNARFRGSDRGLGPGRYEGALFLGQGLMR